MPNSDNNYRTLHAVFIRLIPWLTVFVEPGGDVGNGITIEAFIETARNIAEMRCGEEIFGMSVIRVCSSP